jgi:preprotein translocase subunit SecD
VLGYTEPVSRHEAALRAAKAPGGARLVHDAHGWYALAGDAALGNADLTAARVTSDPATGRPGVAVDLTRSGQAAFGALTREVARHGAAAATPGENPVFGSQHIAIVLDDELASLPYVNYQEAPDGIDPSGGVVVGSDLTPERAREITAILSTGPVPASIEPVSG